MFALNDASKPQYSPPSPQNQVPFLKESLIEKKLIDPFYACIGTSNLLALNEIEKARLCSWLKKSIAFKFCDLTFYAPIHEALFTALDAVSRLPFADIVKIKFVGSFVWSILGRSYVERLFLENGVELKEHISEEAFRELDRDFNKTHRDIDLSIEIPKANEKNREIIRITLIKAFTQLASKYAIKPEKELEKEIHAALTQTGNGNIIDGNTRYLRTPIGSKELMLDINWFESKGREKLFEEDDVSLEVKPVLFLNPENLPEIIPSVSSKTLRPFIDILFGLITISDPFTVNKRGWAKLLLKELKGKKVLIEKDTITLFNSAFSLFLKGAPKTSASFSENFSALIDFCHKEHTLQDFSSHFLLYLQGISSLYYFQNRKDLIFEYENKDIEAIKSELVKISSPKNKEGVLELLHSYLEDKEMSVACLFDFLMLYRDNNTLTFDCRSVRYTLDLKGRRPSDFGKSAELLIKKLNKDTLSHSELLLAIAVNRQVPRPELKEKILFNYHLFPSISKSPICDVPDSVFHTLRDNLNRYPEKEAVLRALFSHPFVFEYGLKWLSKHQELHYLRSSAAVLAFSADPFCGFTVIKSLFSELKLKEKKLILKLVLNKILTFTAIEQKRIECHLRALCDLISPSYDPELSFSAYSSLAVNYPELKPSLSSFLSSERFHRHDGFLSRIAGSPDDLDHYFKSFSPESLRWLLENQKESSPQILSIIRTLYRMNLIDSQAALTILFKLKINSNELPKPLFNLLIDFILDILSKKRWPLDEASTSLRVVELAETCHRKVEFIFSFLELDLIQNPTLSRLVECLIALPLEEKEMKRAWPYAISSNARLLFLTLCLQNQNLESEAILEMKRIPIDPPRLTDLIYKIIEEKKFRLGCLLIRRFHEVLPLDEIVPVLIGKIKTGVSYFDAESLFELFQIPELRKLKTSHAAFVYHKVFQTTSNLLEKRVYSDIKKDFSKEEILRALLIPLVRSIGLFDTEGIKAELPFLLDLFGSVTDFLPIKNHLPPLARKELADCEEGKQFIALLSTKSSIFYELETELLIESPVDDLFLIGIKRQPLKRLKLEYAARLYLLDKEACFDALKNMQNPSLSEQEYLFDIFTCPPPHPRFLELLRDGFFNGLRKSQGRKERIKRLLDLLSAKTALELGSLPLLKEYLSYNGYHYALKWRDEILDEKHYESLHLLRCSSYEESDRIVILQTQFLHREDLRANILKEVSLLSHDARTVFFIEMLAIIRDKYQQHCLAFFNQFIKAEGFIKNNAVPDLLVLISIHFRDHFKTALRQFISEKMKSSVNLKAFTVNCDEFNIAPIETYQSGEPLVIIPHLDHPSEKNIPKNIETLFFQTLGNLLTKFIQDACALHKTPQIAGYLLDFAAINLFYRSEYIRSNEALKNAFEQFLRPVETDLKRFACNVRNLSLIEHSMSPNQSTVYADPSTIKMHISIGNPLFPDSLSIALKPMKEVIQGLMMIAKKEKDFAPVCILHALKLIKGYNIEVFKAYPAIRANHCLEIFSAIEAAPQVLKEDELNLSAVLNAIFPAHEGLSEKEYYVYSELIQVIRAKCYVLFKNAGLEYLSETLNLYAHLLEMNYIRGDEHFLNITTAIVSLARESLNLADESFVLFSKRLKDILCLKVQNEKTIRNFITPFIKGIVSQCLEYFSKSDRPVILNFRIELFLKAKEVYPLVFK